ncbi:hypothetical protein EJB10_02560 [Wolbachia endosymbiont of Brugia malayi]|uniref:S41 family peptidase n=1 Tax=Wolbachia endosymbiont of Brugia malayi TaxID=80849 RepID=UPI0002DCE741|nr:S41 family peptidase [Wolbachia endosymbiont of Brugia malayi]QCB61670.1 hypothetical protein EJB10_02560 [Wolbachia endosymbiont of Brugia malayi]
MQLQINTVSNKIIDNIVYIKISEFNENSDNHFRKQWFNIKENNSTIKDIILDLRDNYGLLFFQAVLICDSFFDGGETVTEESKEKKYYKASKGDIFSGLSVIVLINEKSASASEIVAAAL